MVKIKDFTLAFKNLSKGTGGHVSPVPTLLPPMGRYAMKLFYSAQRFQHFLYIILVHYSFQRHGVGDCKYAFNKRGDRVGFVSRYAQHEHIPLSFYSGRGAQINRQRFLGKKARSSQSSMAHPIITNYIRNTLLLECLDIIHFHFAYESKIY